MVTLATKCVFLNCPVALSFWRRIQALTCVVMGHPEYKSLPIGKNRKYFPP